MPTDLCFIFSLLLRQQQNLIIIHLHNGISEQLVFQTYYTYHHSYLLLVLKHNYQFIFFSYVLRPKVLSLAGLLLKGKSLKECNKHASSMPVTRTTFHSGILEIFSPHKIRKRGDPLWELK